MRHNLIFTGDINLLGVTDPTVPFARVRDRLHAADVVFANLECCFYEPDGERSLEDEGFYAPLKAARSPHLRWRACCWQREQRQLRPTCDPVARRTPSPSSVPLPASTTPLTTLYRLLPRPLPDEGHPQGMAGVWQQRYP